MPVEALDCELRRKAQAMIIQGILQPMLPESWECTRAPSATGCAGMRGKHHLISVTGWNWTVLKMLLVFKCMKIPRKLDDLLKREGCLELLSKRAERVMGHLMRKDTPRSLQIGQITAYLSGSALYS